MEKTLRVLGSEDGHSHSHSLNNNSATEHSHSTGLSVPHDSNGLRSRGADKKAHDDTMPEEEDKGESVRGPSKLSAYLNLFGDFVHNMRVLPCI
jgi:solute carrier family 39 (zinc transporter), member 7